MVHRKIPCIENIQVKGSDLQIHWVGHGRENVCMLCSGAGADGMEADDAIDAGLGPLPSARSEGQASLSL